MKTVVQLIAEAAAEVSQQRRRSTPGAPEGREFSLAITALEDAQMRYTRGRAMQLGRFNPADLDATTQE